MISDVQACIASRTYTAHSPGRETPPARSRTWQSTIEESYEWMLGGRNGNHAAQVRTHRELVSKA